MPFPGAEPMAGVRDNGPAASEPVHAPPVEWRWLAAGQWPNTDLIGPVGSAPAAPGNSAVR
jgi:hypothetical protein